MQTLSGVAVSNANKPLRLVCNTGLKAMREKDEISGLMAAQNIKTGSQGRIPGPVIVRMDPDPGSTGSLDPGSGISTIVPLLCYFCQYRI